MAPYLCQGCIVSNENMIVMRS